MIKLLAKLLRKSKVEQVAVCIYVCKQDEHLLPAFYSSPVTQWLNKDKRFSLFEVFADERLTNNHLEGNRLTLCVKEHYNNLPLKTFTMIEFFNQDSRFDYILKIDVTTLTTAISENIPTGGQTLSNKGLIKLIAHQNFLQDYNGFVRVTAKRPGAENWAKKKSIEIHYDSVFDEDTLPAFYSGKLWLISNEFAGFIVNSQHNTLKLFSDHFPAEDVMIGYMHSQFDNGIT